MVAELGDAFNIDLDAIGDRYLVQCVSSLAVIGTRARSSTRPRNMKFPAATLTRLSRTPRPDRGAGVCR